MVVEGLLLKAFYDLFHATWLFGMLESLQNLNHLVHIIRNLHCTTVFEVHDSRNVLIFRVFHRVKGFLFLLQESRSEQTEGVFPEPVEGDSLDLDPDGSGNEHPLGILKFIDELLFEVFDFLLFNSLYFQLEFVDDVFAHLPLVLKQLLEDPVLQITEVDVLPLHVETSANEARVEELFFERFILGELKQDVVQSEFELVEFFLFRISLRFPTFQLKCSS